MNAQKKRLVVWLIYWYATCGSVWNSAVDCRVEIDGGDLAGLRLAEVLRAKLGVSRSGLERLVEAGAAPASTYARPLPGCFT